VNPDRLSQISTQWSLLFQAHADGPERRWAQAELLTRYCAVVYRYLLAVVRDPHVAEELAQEFAYRFVRGSFRGADPGRVRFRSLPRTSLANLVRDWHRARARGPGPLTHDEPEDTRDPVELGDAWRDELLRRTWVALAEADAAASTPHHAVLSHKARYPDRSSEELAADLTAILAKPMTAAGVRQAVRRARLCFAELLYREVGHLIETDDRDAILGELGEMGLLSYCAPLLSEASP